MPFSLKFVIPFFLSIFLLTQSFVVAYFSLNEFNRNIEQESVRNLNQKMQTLQMIIVHLINLNDFEKIQQFVASLGVDTRIQSAVLVDENGFILSSLRLQECGEHFTEVLKSNSQKAIERIEYLKPRLQGEVALSKDKNSMLGIYPIILGISKGKIKPDRIGVLIIEKEIASLKTSSIINLSYELSKIVVIILILVLLMWLLLHYFVTHRIMTLVKLSQLYSQGLYNQRFPIVGNDEITTLSKAFHEMAQRIEYSHEQLEKRVQERTIELVKANKKLQELDQLKSMFIASMSHELRTPLNSIIGFTDLILRKMIGDINEKQRDYLMRVSRSGKQLLRLITDVIDISKIESGSIAITIEEFELTDIINETIQEVQILIKEKPIHILVEMPESVVLKSDNKLVKQCLYNFLSNAIKFSEEGDIMITIHQPNEDRVNIKVCDKGIGIYPEDMPNLFKAFERFESHLKIIAGGSGLGLYLNKKIAEELLHGEIGVTSEYGKGSCFWIEIPLILV